MRTTRPDAMDVSFWCGVIFRLFVCSDSICSSALNSVGGFKFHFTMLELFSLARHVFSSCVAMVKMGVENSSLAQ